MNIIITTTHPPIATVAILLTLILSSTFLRSVPSNACNSSVDNSPRPAGMFGGGGNRKSAGGMGGGGGITVGNMYGLNEKFDANAVCTFILAFCVFKRLANGFITERQKKID